MQFSFRFVALLSLMASAGVGAQGSGTPPMARREAPSRAGGAAFFLARTGELGLTDAQVVRLAAIARRSEAQRRGLRAAVDSARMRFGGPPGAADSAARRQFRDRMRADLERAREQERSDQRDAIAVLTADQQARAWEMVSRRGLGRKMRGQSREQMMRRDRRPAEMRGGRGFSPRRRDFAAPRAPRAPRIPRPPADQLQ